jgi:P27 family predicted phage terminase small subunit
VSQRGPLAKPVELKALEGNRGHRPLNLGETFRPEVGLPSMPSGLSVGARKVWKRLAPELLRYNLMSAVFGDAFEDLCETVATVKLLRHALAAKMALLRDRKQEVSEAFEVKSPGGMPLQAPLYQTLKAERNHMHACLARFGLAPSEVARVTLAVRAQLQLFPGGGGGGDGDKPDPASPGTPPTGFAEFR